MPLFTKSNPYQLKLRSFLKQQFGIKTSKIHLYEEALLHRSITGNTNDQPDNERLEYLGDSILGAIVSDYLFGVYPTESEGFLSKMRSRIVSRSTLNKIGEQQGIQTILKVSEQASEKQKFLFGNAFEALVGAIYIDKGYKTTAGIIRTKVLERYLDLEEVLNQDIDPKSSLFQWAQRNNSKLEFRVLNEIDNGGSRTYEVQVLINGEVKGNGVGTSKKEAEQAASEEVLKSQEDN